MIKLTLDEHVSYHPSRTLAIKKLKSMTHSRLRVCAPFTFKSDLPITGFERTGNERTFTIENV